MDSFPQEARDLLIELKVQVENIRTDIRELRDGTSMKISDHEKRLGCLEKTVSNNKIFMGIYSAIGAMLISLLVYHIVK
jgi:hypothetical protein